MRRRMRKRDVLEALEQGLDDTIELTKLKIKEKALPYSGTISRTLRSTYVERKGRTMEGSVYSPYFWSRIIDEGRKGARKPKGKWYVWFPDPLANDPRLSGDYHRTWAQARRAPKLRIPRDRFRDMIKSGELIISKKIGPVSPANFVDQGTVDVVKDYRELMHANLYNAIIPFINGPTEYQGRAWL